MDFGVGRAGAIVRSFGDCSSAMHPFGLGIFSSSLILAVMIIPYAASLGGR